MTEEQIQQNAEDYINENTQGVVIEANVRNFLLDVYLAGAHSRDEEIGTLEGLLKIREHELKLRNPWISVEERLPGKSRGLYKLEEDEQHKHVLFRTRNGLTFSGYLDAEEIWRDERSLPVYFITSSPVTHWMPIPDHRSHRRSKERHNGSQ